MESNTLCFNLVYSGNYNKLFKEFPKSIELFNFLAQHMDMDNDFTISIKDLTEAMSCSSSTVSRALSLLKSNDFIAITKSSSDVYCHVNHDIVRKIF